MEERKVEVNKPIERKAEPKPSGAWGVLGYIGLFLLGCTGIGLLFVIPYLAHARITIRDGYRGISYNYGKLEILEPGVHWLMNIFHYLDSTVPVGQSTSFKIPQTTVRTTDNIEARIDAEMIYKVTDIERYTLTGFRAETLRDAAKGALCETYQSLSLEQIAPHHVEDEHDKHHHSKSKKTTADGKSIHAEIKKTIQGQLQTLVADWGIEIINFRLTSFDIVDQNVRNSLAQPTILMRQAEAQLQTAEATAQTAMVKAKNDAETMQIHSEAEANKLLAIARAEAEAIRIKAAAETEAVKTLAHVAGNSEQLASNLALLTRQGDILKNCNNVSLLNTADIFSGNYNPTFLGQPKSNNNVATLPLNPTDKPIVLNQLNN